MTIKATAQYRQTLAASAKNFTLTVPLELTAATNDAYIHPTGKFIAIKPGVYTLRALLPDGEVPTQIVTVNVVKLKIQYRIGTSDYKDVVDFATENNVTRVLFGVPINFKVVTDPSSYNFPCGGPNWFIADSSPTTGSGQPFTTTIFSSSTTDIDFKTLTLSSGAINKSVSLLISQYILGVHSSYGLGTPAFAEYQLPSGDIINAPPGHAWISLSQTQPTLPSSAIVTTYGNWPDTHAEIINQGLNNGAETDIRINFLLDRQPSAPHGNRYYLLSPSQKQLFDNFVSQVYQWKFKENCSSFAHNAILTTVNVDIDANDFFFIPPFNFFNPYESPRKLGEHIQELEAMDPTEYLNPFFQTLINNESLTPVSSFEVLTDYLF